MSKELVQHSDTALSTEHIVSDWQRVYRLWLLDFRSENTRRNYHAAWMDIYQRVGIIVPDQLNHEHIRIWRLALMKEYSDTTVNMYLSAVSSFYKFVQKNYPVFGVENPVDKVKRLSVNPYGKATILRDDQDIQLLKSMEGDSLEDIRDYAMFLLFLTSAVRVDAVASARVGDLRNQGELVFFRYQNKGGETDEKEIQPYTYAAIKAYLGERGKVKKADPLFLYRDGKPMTPRLIQRIVKARCDVAFGKGHGITPHSLRHTAAMNAAKNSSITEVSSLLRHKNLRVTTIYLQHIDKSAGDNVSKKLDSRYST